MKRPYHFEREIFCFFSRFDSIFLLLLNFNMTLSKPIEKSAKAISLNTREFVHFFVSFILQFAQTIKLTKLLTRERKKKKYMRKYMSFSFSICFKQSIFFFRKTHSFPTSSDDILLCFFFVQFSTSSFHIKSSQTRQSVYTVSCGFFCFRSCHWTVKRLFSLSWAPCVNSSNFFFNGSSLERLNISS